MPHTATPTYIHALEARCARTASERSVATKDSASARGGGWGGGGGGAAGSAGAVEISQTEVLARWEHVLRERGRVYCKTIGMHAQVRVRWFPHACPARHAVEFRRTKQKQTNQTFTTLEQKQTDIAIATTARAQLAVAAGSVETVVNGVSEASRRYEKGDFIVCGSRGGRYPMKAAAFAARYAQDRPQPATNAVLGAEGFRLYTPTGKVCRTSGRSPLIKDSVSVACG